MGLAERGAGGHVCGPRGLCAVRAIPAGDDGQDDDFGQLRCDGQAVGSACGQRRGGHDIQARGARRGCALTARWHDGAGCRGQLRQRARSRRRAAAAAHLQPPKDGHLAESRLGRAARRHGWPRRPRQGL